MSKKAQSAAAAVLGALVLALLCFTALRLTRPPESRPVLMAEAPEPQRAMLPEQALLDINTATTEELVELPGIGDVLAQRIVEWREENGPFRGPEDVMSVRGIGEKTYEGIAPFITYTEDDP